MSGNGYYKHKCKYYLTYNCQNWVWQADSPCAACVAAGRDGEDALAALVVAEKLETGVVDVVDWQRDFEHQHPKVSLADDACPASIDFMMRAELANLD